MPFGLGEFLISFLTRLKISPVLIAGLLICRLKSSAAGFTKRGSMVVKFVLRIEPVPVLAICPEVFANAMLFCTTVFVGLLVVAWILIPHPLLAYTVLFQTFVPSGPLATRIPPEVP